MFEKYTGLPDTTKPAAQHAGHGAGSSESQRTRQTAYYDYSSDAYGAHAAPERGGSSSRASSSRSRRKKQIQRRRLVLLCTTIVLLSLLALAVTVIVKSCSGEDVQPDPVSDVFRSGVYVNSVNLAGLNVEQARAQLASGEEYIVNNIAITLSGEGFSAVITGADMGAVTNLDEVLQTAFNGTSDQSYYTTVSFDEGALATRLDEINSTLSTSPVDAKATFTIGDDGKPDITYTDGTPGYGIDVEATQTLVLDALKNMQYQTAITPPLTTIQPAVTAEQAKAHMTLLGEFTTTYDFKGTAEDTEEQRMVLIPNRAFNVEKAAELINGQMIKPGRTWSFNKVVGDRTEKNGWKLANGIFGGDRFTKQYGGGVCQVSSTLYNAVMQAYPSIDIVERRKHTIPSTYVDKGLDATVDTNHIDFRFKNTSEYPIYIFAYPSTNKKYTQRKRDITVRIYGEALPNGESYKMRSEVVEEIPPGEPVITENKKMYIGEETITAEARSAFVVNVYLDKYINGKLDSSELLYSETYEGNPEKRTVGILPTPTVEPTPTPQHTPTPDTDDMP